MRQRIQILSVVLGIMLLAACSSSPASTTSPTSPASSATTITVNDPWARAAAMTGASASGETGMNHSPTMSGTMGMSGTMEMSGTATMGEGAMNMASGGTSAAYMLIANSGSSADALIRAESDVADTVELHTMVMEGDVMKMTPVEKIDIPAGGTAELKPGGFHVMLIGLRQDLKEGEVVKITLTFQSGSTVQVEAPVRKP